MKFKCKQNSGDERVVLEININNGELTHIVKDNFYFKMFYTEADRGNKILKLIREYITTNETYTQQDIVKIIESNNEGSFGWDVKVE